MGPWIANPKSQAPNPKQAARQKREKCQNAFGVLALLRFLRSLGFGAWDLVLGIWCLGFGAWDLGFTHSEYSHHVFGVSQTVTEASFTPDGENLGLSIR